MTSRILITVLLLVPALLATGCSEDPSPVGAGLLPRYDLLDIDTTTFTPVRSATVAAIPPYPSTRILVGKTGTLESWGLIRFGSFADSLKGVQVLGADILARVSYHFGDSLAPFSVATHPILETWIVDSVSFYSILTPGFYDAASSVHTVLGPLGDTADVVIPIEAALVQRWFDAINDTVLVNFGVVLRPTNDGVVKGFASFTSSITELQPRLRVRYRRESGAREDTVVVTAGVDRFVARDWSEAGTGGQFIRVRNGTSERGVLQFDVSTLPAKAAIHRAVLELTLDRARSQLNSYTVDSLFVSYVGDEGRVVRSLFDVSDVLDIDGRRVYRFEVGPFVQGWVRGARNPSVVVEGFDESNSLDLFIVHGPGAAEALRPRVTVLYSDIK